MKLFNERTKSARQSLSHFYRGFLRWYGQLGKWLWLGLLGVWAITTLAMMFHATAPVLGVVALAGLLVVPGAALLLLMRPGRLPGVESGLLVVGLSVLVLMLSGLVSNNVLTLAGELRPLSAYIQVPWTNILMLGLIGTAYLRNRKRHYGMPRLMLPGWRSLMVGGLFLGLPVLAAVGAARLDSGGLGIWSQTAYGLIAAGAVSLVALRNRVPNWLWPWAIFNMALALLWSISLRGLYATGHDIQLEYYVFQLTDVAQRWTIASFQDAYNACLSITILPTVLKSLTGFDGLGLYKVVYPGLFALAATAVFALGRRYASPVVAFISAFVFVTFPTFFTDMPMLARQEVAFFFFALLLLVILRQNLSVWTRRSLFALMSIGVVLSHYSTTFVMVALLAGAYGLLLGLRFWGWLRHGTWLRGANSSAASGITIGVVVTAVLATAVWTGLYTKTGGNVSETFGKVARALPAIVELATGRDGQSYLLFKGAGPSPQELIGSYVAEKRVAAVERVGEGDLYANFSAYMPVAVESPVSPRTWLGERLAGWGLAPGLITSLGKGVYAMGLQVLLGLAALWALLRWRQMGIPASMAALAVAGFVLLAVQAVLPVIDYGLFRMLQQDLVFLALPLVLTILSVLTWLKVRSERLRQMVVTAAFVVAFLVTGGVVGVLTGGTGGQLALSNSGFYYDAYYTHSQDIRTFAWLKDNYKPGDAVTTDKFTRTKLRAASGIVALEGVTPGQISRQSYVVLAGESISEGRVVQYYNGHLLYHTTPDDFLDANKDLLYSTNRTRIYQ